MQNVTDLTVFKTYPYLYTKGNILSIYEFLDYSIIKYDEIIWHKRTGKICYDVFINGKSIGKRFETAREALNNAINHRRIIK